MVKPILTDELRIELLADNPHLIPTIGQLRYREWGEASTAGFTGIDGWIEITASESGRDELPITWVAINKDGDAIGAAGLMAGSDIEDRPELCPSVVGVIVEPRRRGMGIGRRLLEAIEHRAHYQGIRKLYVVTDDAAAGFYRKCGWVLVQETIITGPNVNVKERVLILTRIL
jgi:N-acetylglutamate synthase-like GNAT family acetyltransferase